MNTTLRDIENQSKYDVAIVGAGMVGASAALGFAQAGHRVIVLEAFELPRNDALLEYTPSYDARSTALSWGSREILESLGVWDTISRHACPIDTVHVSQKGRFGTTQMQSKELKHEALGYVVPNKWLGQCLLAELSKLDITICSPARVKEVVNKANTKQLSVSFEDEQRFIEAELLIIADGNNSQTSKLVGIDHRSESYDQHALIANVSTELPNEGVAYERFTPDGPLALLPLTSNQSALVWTHNSADIEKFLGLSDEDFCLALEEQFGERMGKITRVGERSAYPLKLVRAEEQVRPGIVLLGNAAHSLHPVAGQGFNLALRGVAVLFDKVLSENLQQDPLNAFYQQQKQDQQRTITMSDQLVKVFGYRSFLLSIARDIGLIGLNNTPAMKTTFAKTAMGLADKKSSFSQRSPDQQDKVSVN